MKDRCNDKNMRWSVFERPVLKLCASLKLGVVLLLALSLSLAVATILESIHGTQAVQYLVYGALWFHILLCMLGVNVLFSALARYPWKKRQIGFLSTHFGILVILAGAFVTMRFGIDGTLVLVEGESEKVMSVPGLTVWIQNGDEGKSSGYPLKGTAFAHDGRILAVDCGRQEKIVVNRFLPRAALKRTVILSPLNAPGAPALHLEVLTDQFQASDWIFADGAERTLDTPSMRVRVAVKNIETSEDLKSFVRLRRGEPRSMGFVTVEQQGKLHRIEIDSAIGRWRRVSGSQLDLIVDRYLPHAVVRDNQLVSLSNEPVNPAVQLRIRSRAGVEQRYTVFARFPEFATLHRKHRASSGGEGDKDQLNVTVTMKSPVTDPSTESSDNRLELGLGPDRRIVYRRLKAGRMIQSGSVELERAITIEGGVNFRVMKLLAHAVERVTPQEDATLSPKDGELPSAAHLEIESSSKSPNIDRNGVWLVEGKSENVKVGGTEYSVLLARNAATLPFSIGLNKFVIGVNPGTSRPSSYESQVTVHDSMNGLDKHASIRMNEPLKYGGYIFYQASYQLREGQPPISVLSVNWDPGRWIKYVGSIALIMGVILTFTMNPGYGAFLRRRKKGS